jgi:uncharacterized protein YhaN
MRFERLHLSAFGHFTDRVLEFGDGTPDFHLIFGPNEAGKSTTLAAIADLLFGIETFSRYRFLHDNALHLAATVAGANGTRLSFKRRKGNKNTLLDETGAPMDEARLAALRGPGDRAFFTGMFGLDHHRLRAGGEEIHSAKGDLGQSLFQAGAAIRDLHAVLTRLDAEAGQLFSPLGRNPKINAGIAQYKDVRAGIAKAALKGESWKQVQQDAEDVQTRLAALRRDRDDLLAQRSRLERIHRILPLLARHRDLLGEIAELAQVPLLPADAANGRRDALDRQARCRHTAENARQQIALLRDSRDKLAPEPGLLEIRDAVERLHKRHGEIAKDLADLPARRAERTQLRAQIAAELRALGRDTPIEQARTLLPARPQVAHIRAMIAEGAELAADLRQTRQVADDTRTRLARIAAELAQLPATADSQPLKDAIREATRQGQPHQILREAEIELDRHAGSVAAALAELPLWTGDGDALARLKVPSAEAVRNADESLRRATQRVTAAQAQLNAAREDVQRCDADIAGLTLAGPIATEAAVNAARRRRDDGWRLVRRRFVEGGEIDAAAYAADLPLPDAYEQAVMTADSLADRVKGEAQRATRLEEATRQKHILAGRLASTEREASLAAAALAETEAGWATLWHGSGIAPAPPRIMLDFIEARSAALGKIESWRIAQAAAERLRRQMSDGAAKLGAVLGDAAPSPDFAGLLERAERLSQRLDQIATNRRGLDLRRAADQVDAEAAQQRHALAIAAHDDWRLRWGAVLKPLGLSPETGTAEAQAVLDILDRVTDMVRETDGLDHRIHAMESDVAAFDGEVAALVAAAAPDLATKPTLDALSAMVLRAQAARETDRAAHDLDQRIKDLDRTGTEAEAGLADAAALLAQLCRQAGCTGVDGLEEAERRSARRQQVQSDKAEQERLIVDNGDGLGLAELTAEAAAIDRDQIAAAKLDIEDRLERLEEESGALRDSLAAHKAALEGMNGDSTAAAAAEQAERLAAEIREDAGQYIRLRLGHAMLRQAVENYRKRHQGPLMERAARLFERLTLGAFAGLDTGFDKNDAPILLALRSGGTATEVEGLSEGTRDQLFLALRLAAVEQHLAAGRILPFVADDLLIHFDDERAAAALAVLAELATKTQVLFFTHNRHLVDLAQHRLAEGQATMSPL